MGDFNMSNFKPPQIKLKPKVVVTFIVVLLIGFIGISTFYMVDQTERAVILRFGKFNRISEPGLHIKIPFGIERNYNVPTQVVQTMSFDFKSENLQRSRTNNARESLMLTGDLNIMNVEWIIQYRISDPSAWLFNVESKESTIWDISQSIINMLIGDRGIFDIMGKERDAIEVNARELLNAKFNDYSLGINVTTVRLQSIVPPAGAVWDSFEDVNKAQQDMNRLINEGKEAYNKEIPRARGEAERVIQEARGYAAERENRAIGDVARFNSVYNEYRNNRSVTRTRLYIETIEEIFGNKDETDLIDKSLKNFIPFKGLSEGGSR
ncbi:MAG: FtsH protease activity modulator HflK [Spirochaetaceae bacterium]|nr:FtsH protease activity modulator HflK [Spirochaetaceae bacterium]